MNEQLQSWIWVDDAVYPNEQTTFLCHASDRTNHNYAVAEFTHTFAYDKPVDSVRLTVCGDTSFRLWLNEQFVGAGPVCGGGDFLEDRPLPKVYHNTYDVSVCGNALRFFAQVQLSPVVLSDYSRGHGGFCLAGVVCFADGSTERICTDNNWSSRINRKYKQPYTFDNTISETDWTPAKRVDDIWHAVKPPIPMMCEEKILPQNHGAIRVPAHETRAAEVLFDKIYAGYVNLTVTCQGICKIVVKCREVKDGAYTAETITTASDLSYRSFQFHSIGQYTIEVTNESDDVCIIEPSLIFTHYPVMMEGAFDCNDAELKKVYDVCKWTLKNCRQTIHLDSPRHQEPLACTGDYYIETLMTAFCFGDLRLSAFDVMRTADLLVQQQGRMFHTTYSLLWVQMLKEVYQFTGDAGLVFYCKDALCRLLARFDGYLGDTGVLEYAPDYMFVDWMVVDGFSMHHPPKALGQTCLNAFYYGALQTAAELFAVIDDTEWANICISEAQQLKQAHNRCFYDTQRQLYFDGLNTPTHTSEWLPENPDKRYYSKHSNTLSVLYGLCDCETGASIMEQVINDDSLTDVQPYFMHFVLEALKTVGLFEKYGFSLLDKWKDVVRTCDKGLQEGWYRPEEGYAFDYSHAWGGTPAYQIPSMILGFEMVEPGFKTIRLHPQLFGLEWAHVLMPTPYGMIACTLKQGEPAKLSVPEGMNVLLEEEC